MVNYIELETHNPFTVEYLYIDFKDITPIKDLLDYYNVPAKIDYEQLNNCNYPSFCIRDIKTFKKYKSDIENVLNILQNKLKFKAGKEYNNYYENIKILLDKIDKLEEA